MTLFHHGNRWIDSFHYNVNIVTCFEERVDYHRLYCLPFDILTGVVDDGGMANSYLENDLTHERLIIRKDMVYLIPANLPVLYHAVPNIRFFSFHFVLERYPGLDIFSGQKKWVVENLPETIDRMEKIFNDADPLRSVCSAKALILDFCTCHWPVFDMERIRVFKKYETVFDYVKNHADASTSVGDLAELMNSSQAAFSKRFTHDVGISPKDLLQREVLHKSFFLLSQPEHSVRSVAHQLKFSSEFYFSRFFHRHVGVPPIEFLHHLPNGNAK